MKCYVHPKVEAVGVCSVCKRGVCRSCANSVGGRLYCRADVGKSALYDEATGVPKRGIALGFASGFAYLVGASGMTAGFILVIIGIIGQSQLSSAFMAPLQPVFRYFSGLSNSPGTLLIDLGLLILILGCVDIVAGYYLWQRSIGAGIGTVAVSMIAAVLVIFYLEKTSLAEWIVTAYLVTALVKGLALIAGRKHLA